MPILPSAGFVDIRLLSVMINEPFCLHYIVRRVQNGISTEIFFIVREIDLKILRPTNSTIHNLNQQDKSEAAIRLIINSVCQNDNLYATQDEIKALKHLGVLSHRVPKVALISPTTLIHLLRHFNDDLRSVAFEAVLISLLSEFNLLSSTLSHFKNEVYKANEKFGLPHDDLTSFKLLQEYQQEHFPIQNTTTSDPHDPTSLISSPSLINTPYPSSWHSIYPENSPILSIGAAQNLVSILSKPKVHDSTHIWQLLAQSSSQPNIPPLSTNGTKSPINDTQLNSLMNSLSLTHKDDKLAITNLHQLPKEITYQQQDKQQPQQQIQPACQHGKPTQSTCQHSTTATTGDQPFQPTCKRHAAATTDGSVETTEVFCVDVNVDPTKVKSPIGHTIPKHGYCSAIVSCSTTANNKKYDVHKEGCDSISTTTPSTTTTSTTTTTSSTSPNQNTTKTTHHNVPKLQLRNFVAHDSEYTSMLLAFRRAAPQCSKDASTFGPKNQVFEKTNKNNDEQEFNGLHIILHHPTDPTNPPRLSMNDYDDENESDEKNENDDDDDGDIDDDDNNNNNTNTNPVSNKRRQYSQQQQSSLPQRQQQKSNSNMKRPTTKNQSTKSIEPLHSVNTLLGLNKGMPKEIQTQHFLKKIASQIPLKLSSVRTHILYPALVQSPFSSLSTTSTYIQFTSIPFATTLIPTFFVPQFPFLFKPSFASLFGEYPPQMIFDPNPPLGSDERFFNTSLDETHRKNNPYTTIEISNDPSSGINTIPNEPRSLKEICPQHHSLVRQQRIAAQNSLKHNNNTPATPNSSEFNQQIHGSYLENRALLEFIRIVVSRFSSGCSPVAEYEVCPSGGLPPITPQSQTKTTSSSSTTTTTTSTTTTSSDGGCCSSQGGCRMGDEDLQPQTQSQKQLPTPVFPPPTIKMNSTSSTSDDEPQFFTPQCTATDIKHDITTHNRCSGLNPSLPVESIESALQCKEHCTHCDESNIEYFASVPMHQDDIDNNFINLPTKCLCNIPKHLKRSIFLRDVYYPYYIEKLLPPSMKALDPNYKPTNGPLEPADHTILPYHDRFNLGDSVLSSTPGIVPFSTLYSLVTIYHRHRYPFDEFIRDSKVCVNSDPNSRVPSNLQFQQYLTFINSSSFLWLMTLKQPVVYVSSLIEFDLETTTSFYTKGKIPDAYLINDELPPEPNPFHNSNTTTTTTTTTTTQSDLLSLSTNNNNNDDQRFTIVEKLSQTLNQTLSLPVQPGLLHIQSDQNKSIKRPQQRSLFPTSSNQFGQFPYEITRQDIALWRSLLWHIESTLSPLHQLRLLRMSSLLSTLNSTERVITPSTNRINSIASSQPNHHYQQQQHQQHMSNDSESPSSSPTTTTAPKTRVTKGRATKSTSSTTTKSSQSRPPRSTSRSRRNSKAVQDGEDDEEIDNNKTNQEQYHQQQQYYQQDVQIEQDSMQYYQTQSTSWDGDDSTSSPTNTSPNHNSLSMLSTPFYSPTDYGQIINPDSDDQNIILPQSFLNMSYNAHFQPQYYQQDQTTTASLTAASSSHNSMNFNNGQYSPFYSNPSDSTPGNSSPILNLTDDEKQPHFSDFQPQSLILSHSMNIDSNHINPTQFLQLPYQSMYQQNQSTQQYHHQQQQQFQQQQQQQQSQLQSNYYKENYQGFVLLGGEISPSSSNETDVSPPHNLFPSTPQLQTSHYVQDVNIGSNAFNNNNSNNNTNSYNLPTTPNQQSYLETSQLYPTFSNYIPMTPSHDQQQQNQQPSQFQLQTPTFSSWNNNQDPQQQQLLTQQPFNLQHSQIGFNGNNNPHQSKAPVSPHPTASYEPTF